MACVIVLDCGPLRGGLIFIEFTEQRAATSSVAAAKQKTITSSEITFDRSPEMIPNKKKERRPLSLKQMRTRSGVVIIAPHVFWAGNMECFFRHSWPTLDPFRLIDFLP